MQTIFKTACLSLLTGLSLSPALAAEPAFVTVNGKPVSQATADMFMAQAKSHGMPINDELTKQVREELIKRELMLQQARKAGVDKKAEVLAQAEAEKQRLLAQAEATKQTIIIRAYLDDYFKKNPISDAELRSGYDAMRAKGGNTDYKVRHILLRSEKDALAVVSRLKKGVKFEEIAKESADMSSKESGGDLGWSVPGKFVKPFADAVISLKPSQFTDIPVKSEFGYHIIKLDEIRPLKVPSFEEMKPMLHKQAQEQALRKMVDGLRASAKVE